MLTPADCKDIKLLYVEDDPKARDAMIRIFQKLFENITVGVDGTDGLEKFKNSYNSSDSFSLIITDINMPKLNGINMLKEIFKIDKNIYSMAITANSDQNSFMECVNLGVKGYIIKPMNLMQFMDTLENAVKTINTTKEINILRQYKDIVDRSSIVSKSDHSGKITFVNDKFTEVSGYTRDELIGKNHNILRHPDMPSEVFKDLWKTIKSKKEWHGQVKNRSKAGNSYYVDAMICPIFDQNGEIYEYIGLRNDITDIINPKKQLLDSIKSSLNPLLAIVKVTNFQTLEHLYDEGVIDKLEETLESLILTLMPNGLEFDKVFYLGDGEYALFKDIEDTKSINATQKEIQLKKFQQNIDDADIIIDEYQFDLSTAISFATQKDKIYENVKYGINEAVKTNRDIVFSNGLTQKIKDVAIKNTNTIKMIQKAIKDKKIISYFQPITNNDTMQIEKYESLVRLIDENGKVLSPFFFLDVAKESGYYLQITQIVIDNYFEALNKTDKELSLNLSAIDIEDLEIRNKLINMVTGNIHNAHRMVFELLEDEEVKDFEVVKDFISLVKTFGVQIAIDDFGAGVSNFERLLDYQPDILKIDACLIKNIDKDKYSRDVVETLQLFAWKQKIKTVAEFVDSPEVLQTVKDIGINYTQGYLLGKPEPLQ